MGFARFAITLENRSGVFNPGQTIVGCVHVTNNKPESITGMFASGNKSNHPSVKLIVTHKNERDSG